MNRCRKDCGRTDIECNTSDTGRNGEFEWAQVARSLRQDRSSDRGRLDICGPRSPTIAALMRSQRLENDGIYRRDWSENVQFLTPERIS
jgi:hypothetical protein